MTINAYVHTSSEPGPVIRALSSRVRRYWNTADGIATPVTCPIHFQSCPKPVATAIWLSVFQGL